MCDVLLLLVHLLTTLARLLGPGGTRAVVAAGAWPRVPRVHGCAGAAHMLFLDGVYVSERARLRCWRVDEALRVARATRNLDYFRIPVVAEDTWGGEICTATLARYAASTLSEMLVNSTDLHNYNTAITGRPGPETRNGQLFAPDVPDLGVEPDYDSLGAPIAVYP